MFRCCHHGNARRRTANSGRQTCTGVRTRPSFPNTRRYRSTSDLLPVAFSGLSESLTAGRPSTEVTLQTIEIGSRFPEPSGAHPTKSFVRLVPQPKLILTRPAKCRYVSSIESTSIAPKKPSSFFFGPRLFCFPHLIISSPATIGG